jgi:hypothetical protein
VRSLLHLEEILQAIEEHINHILRFGTNFIRKIVTLALVRVRVQGVATLCACFLCTKACITVWRPLGVLGGLPASHRPSGLVWSDDDSFVCGTRRLLLRGKLHSEGGIKMTGGFSGRPFMSSQGESGRDLVTGKQFS